MSGGIAGRGRPGPAGPSGPIGPTGPKGDAAFTLAIGDVRAVPYGQDPAVTNVGTNLDQVWDLSLVTGATGVLTGPVPPTGEDGTSLGQLYYCTANQTYYSLIELNENDNKWRPLMTQETAIRTYRMDILSMGEGTAKVVGTVAVMLDDVVQKAGVSFKMSGAAAIGNNFRAYIDSHTVRAMQTDLELRGISSVPLTYNAVVNGVTTEKEIDLMSITASSAYGNRNEHHLTELVSDIIGSGTMPGARLTWDEGKLLIKSNPTGAPAATQYGNEPTFGNANSDDLTAVWFALGGDAEYPTGVFTDEYVEVPYA